jgi:hypothetical protein
MAEDLRDQSSMVGPNRCSVLVPVLTSTTPATVDYLLAQEEVECHVVSVSFSTLPPPRGMPYRRRQMALTLPSDSIAFEGCRIDLPDGSQWRVTHAIAYGKVLVACVETLGPATDRSRLVATYGRWPRLVRTE